MNDNDRFVSRLEAWLDPAAMHRMPDGLAEAVMEGLPRQASPAAWRMPSVPMRFAVIAATVAVAIAALGGAMLLSLPPGPDPAPSVVESPSASASAAAELPTLWERHEVYGRYVASVPASLTWHRLTGCGDAIDRYEGRSGMAVTYAWSASDAIQQTAPDGCQSVAWTSLDDLAARYLAWASSTQATELRGEPAVRGDDVATTSSATRRYGMVSVHDGTAFAITIEITGPLSYDEPAAVAAIYQGFAFEDLVTFDRGPYRFTAPSWFEVRDAEDDPSITRIAGSFSPIQIRVAHAGEAFPLPEVCICEIVLENPADLADQVRHAIGPPGVLGPIVTPFGAVDVPGSTSAGFTVSSFISSRTFVVLQHEDLFLIATQIGDRTPEADPINPFREVLDSLAFD